jgi:hypothetical protein
MTTKSAVASSSLIAVAALMSGCATSWDGSYLIGERYFRTELDTQPVIILGVDNWDTTERRVLVEPGEHVIRLQAMPVPGAPQETASFKLDVKPCFTYYIVAVRENRIAAEFTPRVDYAQPLGGCNPNAAKKS